MLKNISFLILDTRIDIISNNMKFLRDMQERYSFFCTPPSSMLTDTLLWVANFTESNKPDSIGLISLKFLRDIQEKYNFIYMYPSNESTDTLLWIVNIISDKSDCDKSKFEIIDYGTRIEVESYSQVLSYFLNCLMSQFIRKASEKYILVHAGAVCKNNKATIMVAPSHGGKTTLVLGLLKKGYKFLSDEVAVIDFESRCVLPFPRGLSIRADSPLVSELPTSVLEKLESEMIVDIRQIDPHSLGDTSLLDNVIFLEGYPDAQNSPEISRIPRYKAAIDLLKYSRFGQGEFQTQLERIILLVRHLNCYRLKVGDIKLTCGLICDTISGGSYD